MNKTFLGEKIWLYLIVAGLALFGIFSYLRTREVDSSQCTGLQGQDGRKCWITAVSNTTIPKGLALIETALKENQISLDECHFITHEIGHRSYLYYQRDFGKIITSGSTLCQYAYQHGVEAEITLRSTNQIEELNKFCELMKQNEQDFTCFHGAGHGWLGATGDVDYSLSQCELLTGNEEDMRQCYLGVFSEFTNVGRNVNSKYKIDPEDPLKTCRILSKKFQEACDVQFSIFFTNEDYSDIDGYLAKCLKYEPEVQSRCVRAIASGYTSSVMLKTGEFLVPKIVFSFSPDLRKDFIYSTVGVLIDGFKRSGVQKDIKGFCGNFSASDRQYCESLISQ